MESSYMGGLDGSDPLGKAVIWSRTEQDVDDLEELQQEQEQVPFSPLPTHSSTTSTTTTSTEDTAWDELDGNHHDPSFHVLYTGHGSPSTKAKIRQSLAQAMSTFYTTTQQQRQRRQRQQSSSLPQQRFNVVTSEALDTDTYEDNGLALWETDATWSLPSMSILLPCDTDDAYYLPQTLHTKMAQLDGSIDLVIYFCNQRHGPLEQDFAALAKLQLPVLPLIIHPASDPDDPPSLSSSFSSTSSQLVNISKPPPSWTVLRETIAAYLHQYHIHCFNVTEIHPEVPGFISNATPCSPSLCHILSANEIMHVDQFTSLDTRTTFRLMTNVRKYNERRRQTTQRKPWWYGWYWILLVMLMMALWTASPLTSRNTLAPLPHMTMAPGYESPDADMYHHFTLVADEKGASQVVEAQLVWDQGGIWTLTKTDWTAHVPSPCKMNWDTDMNLTLQINTNDDAGQWQTTALFILPWTPCHSTEHFYYPHHDDGKTGNDCGSTSYFALTPYQHDVLHQWWLQLKVWTKIGIHSLVNGAKKLQKITGSLYVYHLQ